MDYPPVKTRILIMSDTLTCVPEVPRPRPFADVLIHAGNLTMTGSLREHQAALDMLLSFEAELKLVIPGNHDVTLDPSFYHGRVAAEHDGRLEEQAAVRTLWTGPDAIANNIVYLEKGLRTFRLSYGAELTVYATPYHPDEAGGAFQDPPELDRFNNFGGGGVLPPHLRLDIMITHGPPYGILDGIASGNAIGCEHLLRAVERTRPRLHCFGHVRRSWGAAKVKWQDRMQPNGTLSAPEEADIISPVIEGLTPCWADFIDKVVERLAKIDISSESDEPLDFGRETLFVNASITNARYQPTRFPWIVDMDLPQALDYWDAELNPSTVDVEELIRAIAESVDLSMDEVYELVAIDGEVDEDVLVTWANRWMP